MLNFSPDLSRTSADSAPPLDFASSAYVESLPSTEGCSPSLHATSTANQTTTAQAQTWASGQQSEHTGYANVSPMGTNLRVAPSIYPSQHLPGCPSGVQHYQQQYGQVSLAPEPLGSYASASHPKPCSHHCAINAWQTTQRGHSGYIGYQAQTQMTYAHDHYEHIHSPVLAYQQTLSNPVCIHHPHTNGRLSPESIAEQNRTSTYVIYPDRHYPALANIVALAPRVFRILVPLTTTPEQDQTLSST